MQDERKTSEKSSRSRSRDSGSHSRSGSVSSSNSGCNIVVKVPQTKEASEGKKKTNEFLPKPQKIERKLTKESQESIQNPPPLEELKTEAEELDEIHENHQERPKLGPRHSLPPKTTANSAPGVNGSSRGLKRVTSVPVESSPPPPPPPLPSQRVEVDDEPRGAEIVEVVEEPTLRPSQIVKSMCRSMSAICKYLILSFEYD